MRRMAVGLLVAAGLSSSSPAFGGVIFGSNGNLGGGFRWDAGLRNIGGGQERSLVGGIRYSLQGGSYEAFRDLFTWQSVPTVDAFTQAVEQAFGAWTSIDPITGLGTSLSFVADLGTAVVGTGVFGTTNVNGAEIDLFATNAGDTGTRAVTGFFANFSNVTLTSGTTNYGGADGGGYITGADIQINNNNGATYSLDLFRRLLTHEIGHALGIGDAEGFGGLEFIDDNYDGTSHTTAAATLNNSWALLVNPLNPEDSPGLTQFNSGTVVSSPGIPGIQSPGVNLLMESNGLGIAAGNPLTNPVPLTNDEYGTRQFLYPEITAQGAPEPSSFIFAAIAGCGFWARSRRRRT